MTPQIVSPEPTSVVIHENTMAGTLTYAEFQMLQKIGQAFAASGMFKDITDMPKALVKMMFGRELGLQPIASVANLDVFEGKVRMPALLIGALIKRQGYNYRPTKTDDKGCTMAFFGRNGEQIGSASFTEEHAKKVIQGSKRLLDKDNWKCWTEEMYFWRALTKGARQFFPEVFAGIPIYTPEELTEITMEDPIASATASKAADLRDRIQKANGEEVTA
jgi:hypothetical protein